MHFFRLLFCILFAATSVAAFCPPHATPIRERLHSVSLNLVTEDDVIALVEKAEDLWAKVEKLRNEANELSIEAESLGQDAESSAADAMEALKSSISEEKLAEANTAQNLSIDLGSLLDKAMRSTQEADEIEVIAGEALTASEVALEQHLIDFPED